jgi:hypothetical protein
MQLSFRTADHAELIGGHNFCRNPASVMEKPWCYVHSDKNNAGAADNINMVKRPCRVPVCSE